MDQSASKMVRQRETTNRFIAATLVALIVLGAAFAFWSTTRMLDTLHRVDDTLEVRLELQHAVAQLRDAESAERGYLLTGQEELLQSFEPNLTGVRESLVTLRKLTSDNPEQQKRLDYLAPLLDKKIASLHEQIKARLANGQGAAVALLGRPDGRQLMQDIRKGIEEIEDAEAKLLERRTEAARSASHLTLFVVALGSAAIIALVGVAAWLTQRELQARKDSAQLQHLARDYAESIVDTVREPLVVLDQEMRIERANRAYYEIFGANPEETEHHLFAEVGEGQWNGPELAKLLRETLSLDKRFDDLEWEYRHPDGSRRMMLLNACKLYRPGSESEAILLAIEDITVRKKAEQELRASEERYRTIVDSVTGYAIFMLDPEGKVANWSRGAERIEGYKSADIIGRHFSRFYPSEDVAASLPERELTEAREKGRTEDEGWRVRKDGTRFFANVIISAVRDASGELKGFVILVRDVTERHRIEQMHVHFRALFDSLPGLYVVMTPDFGIVAVSDAFLKATMTEREGLLGHKFFDVFPDNPNDPHATGETNVRASLNRVLKTNRSDTMSIQKYDIRRPDGTFEERYWSPVNSPVLGADRQIEYLIHRVEDVTEFVKQKREAGENVEMRNRLDSMAAEVFRSSQQVQAANNQLRAANAELEAFSYSVSHDLRAPLRHIDGFADLLTNHASATLDDKGRRYLKTISDSAKRMGALIDDLLVFSRIGRAEMRRTAVNLNALVDEVIHDLRIETNGRNVVWKRQELPMVDADPALLRQVFVNLLANAVKYTRPRDPATIEVGCVKKGDEDTLYVRDNGVGFDMTYVGKLFGVFQRLHRADEFEGTGIGLANVQRIIVRHGGRVWAEGQTGEGATFYFTLPSAAGSNLSMSEPVTSSHDSQS